MSVPSFTIAGLLALLATLGFLASISSRFIRSRLWFSLWLLLAFLGLQVAVSQGAWRRRALRRRWDGWSSSWR